MTKAVRNTKRGKCKGQYIVFPRKKSYNNDYGIRAVIQPITALFPGPTTGPKIGNGVKEILIDFLLPFSTVCDKIGLMRTGRSGMQRASAGPNYES